MYHDHHGYYDGGHPFFGWLMALLFFALLVVLAVVAVRWFLGARQTPSVSSGTGQAAPDDALTIARTRYARGEIDRDEFLRLTEDLTGAWPQPPKPAAP